MSPEIKSRDLRVFSCYFWLCLDTPIEVVENNSARKDEWVEERGTRDERQGSLLNQLSERLEGILGRRPDLVRTVRVRFWRLGLFEAGAGRQDDARFPLYHSPPLYEEAYDFLILWNPNHVSFLKNSDRRAPGDLAYAKEAGIISSASVPESGLLQIASVPPTILARSCIPLKP